MDQRSLAADVYSASAVLKACESGGRRADANFEHFTRFEARKFGSEWKCATVLFLSQGDGVLQLSTCEASFSWSWK